MKESKETRSRMVTLRMTPRDNDLIEEVAKFTYRTKSEMIVYATTQYLKEHKEEWDMRPLPGRKHA